MAITQNKFETANYLAEKGCFNLSKSIVKPFLSSGLRKTALALELKYRFGKDDKPSDK